MRRVLFGSGFPQRVPNPGALDPFLTPINSPDGCLQILDLRNSSDETQSFNRFITLFAWTLGPPITAEIYVQVGDQTPYIVGKMDASNDVASINPSSMKLQIRGDVRVIAAASAENACAVFGYLELEDPTPSIEVARPLQSSFPVSPFTVAPLSLITSESATLHAFERGFVDTVTIDYVVGQTVANTGVVLFTFPNGVSLATKELGVINGQVNIMSGIPMLPFASGDLITVTADADISRAVVSGTFTRE